MMMKIAAIAASVPLAVGGAVAATGVVVVDVRELGRDGSHIVVPVPLGLVRAAAGFVPAQKLHGDFERVAPHLETARGVLQALAEAPDGELVRVEEADEQVIIAKEGTLLRVRVHGRGEDVNVSVPLALAQAALPDPDGRLSPAALASALGSARFTDLVDVRTDSELVKVTVY